MAPARVSVNAQALFLALSLPQTGLSLELGYTLLLGKDISRYSGELLSERPGWERRSAELLRGSGVGR
ncbi:uncharacterized [Tachysurus ichikawai]